MRQALEMALDWIQKQPEETPHSKYDVDTRYVVIREIEAALAQPERDYERGFIDGMQKQMQSSVDKAVNRLAQPEQEYGVVAGVGKGVEIPAGVKYYYIEPKLPPQRKPLTSQERDAKRWRFLMENSYDSESVTQFHVWEHSWEPHSQTGEPTEWKQRVRGIALIDFIDRAIEAAHGIKE